MARRARQSFWVILLLTFCAGCHGSGNTVVVHVFRDQGAPNAAQVTRAVERFQALKIHATDGKLIIVEEVEPGDYRARLGELGQSLKPELVFLNARADAEKNPLLREELNRAVELGGEGRRFVAFIPSWVAGDELLATRTFVNYLVSSGELW